MNVYMGRCVNHDIMPTTGRIRTDGVKRRDRLEQSRTSPWGMR